MAKENAERWERDLKEDPLVAALVPDPAKLPVNAAVLRGFVGKSLKEGSWRLYLDAELTEYVEIPESEILYARELPDGGGTAVWVPGTLTLDRVRVAATQIQAEFLSGTIAARGLPAAVQALGPRGEFVWPSSLGGCRHHGISIDSPCLQVQGPGGFAGFVIPGIGPDVTAFCPPGLLPVPHPHFPK